MCHIAHPVHQQVLSASALRANKESSHFPSPSHPHLVISHLDSCSSILRRLPAFSLLPSHLFSSFFCSKPSRVPISEEKSESYSVRQGSTHLSQQHLTLMPWPHLAVSLALLPVQPCQSPCFAANTPGTLQPQPPGPCWTCNAPSYCRARCLASRRCLLRVVYSWRPSLTSLDEADHCHQSLPLLFPSISLHNINHHVICHIFVVWLPHYILAHWSFVHSML